ncbi:hypothetical protein [Stutzerimonas stutzeri]|uniref:hypothetical protein n=1 Tax=Stutzerimonas stutzeri TaxID=316 RepID=UPI0015E44E3A|nr:hypothetical protein [Stutzerimonas stutzeri]MBA1280310.1 hypothetical protein [Stutzerimonas stutzeri]
MGNRSHNSRLHDMIKGASAAAETAASKDELLEAVQIVRDFPGPLQFDQTKPKAIAVVFGVLCLAAIAFALWAPVEAKAWLASLTGTNHQLVQIGCAVLFGIATAVCFAFMGNRASLLKTLSTDIARRSSLLSAGLTPVSIDNGQLLKRLEGEFRDYQRGNYSRDITLALTSAYVGETHQLDYSYCHLHYVNKRVVTKRVSDGRGGYRTKTETVYDHYDRFSLVVDFPWVKGIAVRANGHSAIDFKHPFVTTSSDFARAFVLTGISTMECVKFAKPVTVLHLLKMKKQLSGMNLELSLSGRLCLSFEVANLLDFDMPCDLGSPDEFYQLIDAGVRLPYLTNVLAMVHRLAEQHDDNFSLPAAITNHTEN